MNLFHSAITALALMIPFGLAQATTLNPVPPSPGSLTNPHPPFSRTEDRTLNLRETGSEIVIQTIENSLQQGGLALLGEGFQLDSSIDYDFGDVEGIRGDLDVVIPLLNWRGHVVFAQPGAIFWTGIEKEERIDGNVGLVYRTEVIRDLIAGVSVFYDHDFQIGHSRVSGGIDLQSGSLLLGVNYYHVLSETEDGREGFLEEAVDGMDLRLALEKEIVRAEANIGYWDYQGEENTGGENSQSGWQTSMGIDFGVRIIPGVFVEAGWERHKDDLVLDERIFAGLAFRFSLPDLEGVSYGDGGMSSNLYKIVDRERRILYEEREKPVLYEGSEPNEILLLLSGSVVEGGTVNVAVQLRRPAAEDIVINLTGSGSAEYGSSDDYTVSIGGTPCTGITENGCQVTVMTGETAAADDVVFTINDDGRGEDAETIILSAVVAARDTSLTGNPLILTIPADPSFSRVSIVRTGSGGVSEGDTVELDIRLNEVLKETVTVNLVGSDSKATYGSSNDWTLSVGGTVCAGVANDECQVSITAGQVSAGDDVVVTINDDGRTSEDSESIILSIGIDAGSAHLVQAGSPLTLNIPSDPPLPTVSMSADSTSITEGNTATITLTLSESIGSDVTFNLLQGGAATYGTSDDWNLSVGGTDCSMAGQTNPCQVTISRDDTTAEVTVKVRDDMTFESREEFSVSLLVDSGSASLVTTGSSSVLNFNIPDHRPIVSLSRIGGDIPTFQTRQVSINLSEALSQSITINVTPSGTATYGIANDWTFGLRSPANSGNYTTCNTSTPSTCQVTIDAGDTTAQIRFVPTSGPRTTMTVSIALAQASQTLVRLGNRSVSVGIEPTPS